MNTVQYTGVCAFACSNWSLCITPATFGVGIHINSRYNICCQDGARHCLCWICDYVICDCYKALLPWPLQPLGVAHFIPLNIKSPLFCMKVAIITDDVTGLQLDVLFNE